MRLYSPILLLLLTLTLTCQAQDSTQIYKNRKTAFVISTGLVTGGSLIYLNQAWYAAYNTGQFHFFQDAAEWMQMDKAGHFYTTYQTARFMMGAMQNCKYSDKYSFWVGGLFGLTYMSAIEVMDGFSRGWGFSTTDMWCNIGGSAMAMCQEKFWRQQKIMVKFSYSSSGIAQHNPSLLGENNGVRVLKDYNGQKYWLTVSPFSFISKHAKWNWLCLSVGYGATGMINATVNYKPAFDAQGNLLVFERYRKGYLSLDIDLTKIKVKKAWLKKTLSVLNMMKVPFPAIEFSKFGLRFHGILY